MLPFDVIGGAEPRAQALSDGLAVDLASRLSRVPGVTVAPRTSVRAMSGQPIREIGQRLGARLVVEGSIQAEDGRVRVTATLVEAARERAALPSLVVERPFDSALDSAGRDRRAPSATTSSPGCRGRRARATRRTPEAFHAFKRGQHHWRSCFGGGWRHAIEHFQHAIDRDPQFALAHVALASAYNFLGFYALVKPALAFAVAARAAERALAIDPTLGAAYTEIALAKFGGDWDWDGAEEAFRRGLALDRVEPAGARPLLVAADAPRAQRRRVSRSASAAIARAVVAAGRRRPRPDDVCRRAV